MTERVNNRGPNARRRPVRCLLLGLLLAGCTTAPVEQGPGPEPRQQPRPTQWAQPVASAAVDNWHEVSPALHRCAQPSSAGMRALQAAGIKSVLNLRDHHTDDDEIAGTGLHAIAVPLGTTSLSYEELVGALVALERAPKPVAVHCWRGSDRTGTVVAAWRVAVQGWTPAAALAEMVEGGYGHSWLFGNLRKLIRDLDADRLRADVAVALRAGGGSR